MTADQPDKDGENASRRRPLALRIEERGERRERDCARRNERPTRSAAYATLYDGRGGENDKNEITGKYVRVREISGHGSGTHPLLEVIELTGGAFVRLRIPRKFFLVLLVISNGLGRLDPPLVSALRRDHRTRRENRDKHQPRVPRADQQLSQREQIQQQPQKIETARQSQVLLPRPKRADRHRDE